MHVPTTLSRIALAVVLLASLTAGTHPYARADAPAPARAGDLADLIVYAGHGAVFDRNMKEVRLDPALIARIQDAMLARIRKSRAGQKAGDPGSIVDEAEKLLASRKLTAAEVIVVRSGLIGTLLMDAPKGLNARYTIPNRAILSNYLNRNPQLLTSLSPEATAMAVRLGALYPPGWSKPDPSTFYRDLCRLVGVPIPPDWAEEGTPWVRQGSLTTKLILAEKEATVWTYSDPRVPGACIALPRGDGTDPDDQVGIICQGAATGAACFWDNIRRGENVRTPWRGERLVIAELQDGTNLVENCTGCHRGDNVFLIAPDDPTWAKVLRGPLEGPRTGTFTTQLDPSVGPRPDPDLAYAPISGWRDRPGWTVPRLRPGCAVGCHLESVDAEGRSLFGVWANSTRHAGSTRRNMPPACAEGPSGTGRDVRGCYGVP